MDKRKNRRNAVSSEVKPNLKLYRREQNEDSHTPAQHDPESFQNEGFTPIDHISQDDFFSYYATMSDVVLPQLNIIDGVIISVLFHQSYGSGRNYCKISLSELVRRIGASRNTIRTHLKSLIEKGWVCILSESHREATTYGLRIPLETNEE